MTAVPITIVGILTQDNGLSGQATLVGMASLTGVGVGGGPVVPPGSPPGIWGGPGSLPPSMMHPIAPSGPSSPDHIWGGPGGLPPVIGGGPIPPMPTEPPEDGGDKPPPEGEAGWGYLASQNRWGYFPGPNEAQPKTGLPPQ